MTPLATLRQLLDGDPKAPVVLPPAVLTRLRALAEQAQAEYDAALADAERWQRRAEEAERRAGVQW